MISEKALQEFKKIYKEQFGEEISNERAVELGINLLVFFDNVYKPIKKEWLDTIAKSEELKQ